MKPTLVIMAAGLGSRYGGLKQIDPVGVSGEVIMEYSVYDAIRSGFGKVIFVVRPENERAFRVALEDKFKGEIEVLFALQRMDDLPAGFVVPAGREKSWGTGQAVLAARDMVHEPFAVINADDFYGHQSIEIISDHLRNMDVHASEFALVGYYVKNTLSENGTVSRGVCRIEEGRLRGLREVHGIRRGERDEIESDTEDLNDHDVVSMNLWGFSPRLFEVLQGEFEDFLLSLEGGREEEFQLPGVVDRMIQRDEARVAVLPTNDEWMGVTYAEDKPHVVAGVRAAIEKGAYPRDLWRS